VKVRGKYKDYWRLKRGTLKRARLNKGFQRQSEAISALSPITAKIKNALESFTWDLQTDYVQSRMNGLLSKVYEEEEPLDLGALKGLEFQRDHPFRKLVRGQYRVERDQKRKVFRIIFQINRCTVDQPVKGTTHYSFMGVVLYGDPFKNTPFGILHNGTPQFKFDMKNERMDQHVLEVPFPKKNVPWMLCLRVQCYDGPVVYFLPRSRAMIVVDGGKEL
jgi:hypothetical protein